MKKKNIILFILIAFAMIFWAANFAVAAGESAANSIISVTPTQNIAGGLATITLTCYDALDNPITSGGATVVFNVTGSNSATPAVTDNDDGTYTATYTSTNSGVDQITATLNAVAVGKDTEGDNDGIFHLTVMIALYFTDDVDVGPIISDTITVDWGDASVKKWDYDTDRSCSLNEGSYTKTDADSMDQAAETNNTKYICLYAEDALGDIIAMASDNDINIDLTPPVISFTNDVAAGPVISDTVTVSWGDASVKKWDYDADGTCSLIEGDYTKTDADSLSQATETNNTQYICLYAEDALGNFTTLASANDINIDVIDFTDNVAAGPVISDTVTVDWENATVRKWDYDADGACSLIEGDYTKTDANSLSQATETNNTQYICLYAEDALGNIATLASANDINIDITAPVISFTDDVAAGPVISDTVTVSWGDASVKKWDYDADGACSLIEGNYTKTDADSMDQAAETNNTEYICLYAEDALGNIATLASANDINIDITAPVISFTNNVAPGPVASDTITVSWGDSSVKKWDYDADGNCSLIEGDYTKTDADSLSQATETNNTQYICLYAEDIAGNISTLASANDINIDLTPPTISFTDNVAAGPVISDTITVSWGDASVKKWDYDADGTCSLIEGNYTKTDADSMDQATETNNTKYICLYAEDALGNIATLASANDINIDLTPPTISFTNNVAAGPVMSDTITVSWGDATVKKWDYDADGVCSLVAGDYTKTDADSLSQATETNNTQYICLYGEDALANFTTLASANDINIDATPSIISFTDNVAAGPVISDTITVSWGDASVKKWDYDANGVCSLVAGDYTKTDANSMNQAAETNNTQYICLYAEDALGNIATLASANDINIDLTPPVISFTDNVAPGPVMSDTITVDWGDATVKKWDYDANGTCSLNEGDYTKTDADSMDQAAETNNTQYICLYVEDALGNFMTLASANDINIDTNPSVISFTDNVAAGPVISDTVTVDWGDASVKKWDYDADGTCSIIEGNYTKTDANSLNQATETNNTKYICLYAEDIAGNISTLASTYDININALSFTDNVAAGPVISDTITVDWGDASVKKWDYDADGACSLVAGNYTKTDADSLSQATETNNTQYICLYAEDALGNIATLASANDINIEIDGGDYLRLTDSKDDILTFDARISKGETETEYISPEDDEGTQIKEIELTANDEYIINGGFTVKKINDPDVPNLPEELFGHSCSVYTQIKVETDSAIDKEDVDEVIFKFRLTSKYQTNNPNTTFYVIQEKSDKTKLLEQRENKNNDIIAVAYKLEDTLTVLDCAYSMSTFVRSGEKIEQSTTPTTSFPEVTSNSIPDTNVQESSSDLDLRTKTESTPDNLSVSQETAQSTVVPSSSDEKLAFVLDSDENPDFVLDKEESSFLDKLFDAFNAHRLAVVIAIAVGLAVGLSSWLWLRARKPDRLIL